MERLQAVWVALAAIMPSPSEFDDATSKSPHGLHAPLRRRLFVGTAWVLAGRALSMAALFAVNVLLAHRVNDAELSAYLLASFIIPFLALLANLGTPEILMRDIRVSLVQGRVDRVRHLITASLVICITMALVVGAAMIVALRAVHFEKAHWQVIQQQSVLFALWVVFQTTCQVVGEAFRGCDKFASAAAIYTQSGGWITNTLSAALIFSIWPHAAHASFTQVMLIQVIATAIPALAGMALLYRGLPAARQPDLTSTAEAVDADAVSLRWLIVESWPVFVSTAVLIGIEQLDILTVFMYCSDSDAADYGVAKRWLGLVNFAFVSLAPAITPFIAELHERGDPEKLKRLMRGAATIVAIPTIVICVALLIGARPAITYFFGSQRVGAVPVLRILLIGQVFLALAGHSYVALAMTGRQRSLMYSSLAVGAFYVVFGPLAVAFGGITWGAVAKCAATIMRAVSAAALVRTSLGFWSTASLSPAALAAAYRPLISRLRRVDATASDAASGDSVP
jgi:O-antigen/teichoic acid export membrane protein